MTEQIVTRVRFGRANAFLLVVAPWVFGAAMADLPAAYAAYEKHDFPLAFQAFHELAELGQPLAQRNVAIMYMNAEGTEKSVARAYAWASLAVEGGAEKAGELAAQLKPLLRPDEMKIVDDIRTQYGRSALETRLFPQFSEVNKPDEGTCRKLKVYEPTYPVDALREARQVNINVEFTIMPDGRARMPRMINAFPSRPFEEAVRKSVLRSEFIPATFNGRAGPCLMSVLYRFVVRGKEASDYPDLGKFVKEARAKAEAGEVRSQMLYGMLLEGLPQLKGQRSDALPWFLKAAQAGAPLAQYQVGYSILKGWGCQCEEPKGMMWLRKAAAADQPDAQVTLAQATLRESQSVESVARAKVWLERAVAHDNRDAKFYLAALLAAAPLAEARDATRSAALLAQIFKAVDDDPTTFEIRAAAQAASGDFAKATKNQQKAVAMAKRLKWDLTSHNERLARYEAHEAWYGNLLPF